jgi:translation initiation factor IF-2
MNVTELARKLRTTPAELFTVLPEHGIDIGKRAIKIDDRTAGQVVKLWSRWKQERERVAKLTREKSEIEKAVSASGGSIRLPKVVTVRDLASRINLPITRIISELMKNGILASMNERIDFETASILAEDLGFKIEPEPESISVESGSKSMEEKLAAILAQKHEGEAVARPPVVVVMGHVDHGKTKTLDAIRKTDVVAGEAGGITQHIGAYQVTVAPPGEPSSRATSKESKSRGIPEGRKITFIDTPGHEAFMTMRSRGARIADIAILVVAADDGVQPQTLEALGIIEAAKIPFLVVVNKIDKPDADVEKIKRQLAERNVQAEDWGGKIPFVPISAKEGKNIDGLLEMVLLIADVNKDKLTANPDRRAVCTVIESHIDAREGIVTTVLIAAGTLKVNDPLAIDNTYYGRVRAMRDWNGKPVKEALPGMPVKIMGLRSAPTVGDVIDVPADVKVLEKDIKVSRTVHKTVTAQSVTSDDQKTKKMVKIVLKTDVLGSLEALIGSFEKFQHDEVGVEVVGRGLGNVTESDVLRAEASGARVYGFNVLIPTAVENLAREKKVPIKTAKVIYDILDDVKAALQELLPEQIIRTELGKAKVLAIFRTEKAAMILGGAVTDGHVALGATVQVHRGEEIVEIGEVVELQSAKQKVKEVRAGSEFGTKLKIKPVVLVGDQLVFFHIEKKERKIQFS